MHRFPSKTAIRRIRFAAFLLGAKYLLAPAAAGVMIHSVTVGDRGLAGIGIGMVALTGLVVLMQWLIAARANCPLCLTPVLTAKDCAKHRNARSFLGSHRLRVALEILFRNCFRCPYCGESTALEVRTRRGH